jgi:serine/threonine protein kinase
VPVPTALGKATFRIVELPVLHAGESDEEKTQPFVDTAARALNPLVPPFRPGEVVAGKYRVEEILGCGGMAWVLRATHLQLNQKVALKFLRFAASGDAVERFFHEGRAAARVSSDAVTRVLDVGTLPDGQPFLVMEYLEGRDLEKVLEDPGLLPIGTAVDFAIQACEGLAEVHAAGIVHRDLKPANLFLTRKRNGSIRMKLLDFGISKFAGGGARAEGPSRIEAAALTSTQALLGSPVYMAPEQMRSSKHVDARADIWSLGVILYELLTGGRSPFPGQTLPEVCHRVMNEPPEPLAVREDVPPGLLAILTSCLEKDPARRFPNAVALALALSPYASKDGKQLVRRMQHRTSMPVPNEPLPSTLPSRPSPRPSTRGSGALSSLPSWVHGPARWVTFATRHAVSAVALFGLLVGVAVASFAFGIRMAIEHRDSARTAELAASAGAIGVTNQMPAAAPTASAATAPVVLAAPPAEVGSEHVYTPDELPLAPPARPARAPHKR